MAACQAESGDHDCSALVDALIGRGRRVACHQTPPVRAISRSMYSDVPQPARRSH